MCQIRTTNYAVCAHRRTNKQRCQNYLSKPKTSCEKLHYNDTVLDLCPKCSPMPSKPASSPLLGSSQRPGTNSVQSSESALVGDQDCKSCNFSLELLPPEKGEASELGMRKKAVGGLRRMFSVRSDRGRRIKADKVGIGSSPNTEAVKITETEKRVRSSEQLAEEYRGILSCHPNTVLSVYGRARDVPVPKEVDIETCTTWSQFLPRQETLIDMRAVKAVEVAGKRVQNRPENKIPRKDEELRLEEETSERRVKDRPTPLDPVRMEELRKAKERLGRVSDVRGVMLIAKLFRRKYVGVDRFA